MARCHTHSCAFSIEIWQVMGYAPAVVLYRSVNPNLCCGGIRRTAGDRTRPASWRLPWGCYTCVCFAHCAFEEEAAASISPPIARRDGAEAPAVTTRAKCKGPYSSWNDGSGWNDWADTVISTHATAKAKANGAAKHAQMHGRKAARARLGTSSPRTSRLMWESGVSGFHKYSFHK